jgi:hypothetical protein
MALKKLPVGKMSENTCKNRPGTDSGMVFIEKYGIFPA